jgi:F-type H+-transporting ATPase subunit b
MTNAALVAAESSSEHSILLPEAYDILWGTVSFILLFILFRKFVLPPMRKVMAERAEKIEGGIARARAMQDEAEASRAKYQQALSDAAQEAAQIRAEAHTEGGHIIAAARDAANVTAAGITARADAQIAADRDAAVGALKTEVGGLAVALASKIVGESLTDDARAKATIDRFIAELEAAAEGQPGGGR